MISGDVVLDYHLWGKKIRNPKTYIKKKLVKLNKLKLFKKKSKNHTIFLTNNKKMRELNKKFKNKNKTIALYFAIILFPIYFKHSFISSKHR